jgi:transcriptional regulator with XRE-family HTH domain
MNPSEGGKRRELEPTHTKGYVHVPLLREKLGWLYGWHPLVKTQYLLAREMGVSPATLSSWLNGRRYSDTRNVAVVDPDSIPKKYFQQFLDVWPLTEDTMQAADLAQFKSALQDSKVDRHPWERLVGELVDDERIEIVANVTRGLIDPDETDADGIPQFRPGDGIALRVKNPNLRHGVMLLQDRTGWSSLRPTPKARGTEIDGDLIFPRQLAAAPVRFAHLDATIGMHRVLVVLMDDALPPDVINILLARPVDSAGLIQIVSLLQNRLAGGSEKCRMLSRRFIVTSGANET